MNLGEKIYQLRTQKNLSQGDLADALEVSRQSISKWETNTSVPELDKLVKLSKLFDVTLDELVLDAQQQKTQPEPQVVYVERPAAHSGRRTLGIVLLCLAALLWILCTALGDFFVGLFLALPFGMCGTICLVVKRNPGLWCLWVAYGFVELYLRLATGINWGFALNLRIYKMGMTVQLIVAWVLLACFVGLVWLTVLRLRKNGRTAIGCAIGGILSCAAFLVLGIVLGPLTDHLFYVTAAETFSLLRSAVWLLRDGALVAMLVFASQWFTCMRIKKKI